MWDTAARHGSLHTGLMLNQDLCYEAERTPDPSDPSFYKVISKVYFNMASQQWQPVITKGAWQQSLKEKQPLHTVVVVVVVMKQHQEPLPH